MKINPLYGNNDLKIHSELMLVNFENYKKRIIGRISAKKTRKLVKYQNSKSCCTITTVLFTNTH